MKKRRFEYVGNGSDKFWSIQVSNQQVTVHFGRNGTNGQTQTKSFANDATALQHAERMIRQKTVKGYQEKP